MKNNNFGQILFETLISTFVYALILSMASMIFNGFLISNFWYALLAALIMSLLNTTVKPFLIFITMPVTIFTVGLFYPFINVIVLKITSWILGVNFIVEGWLVPFFIAIFISIMKIMLDAVIVKPITRGR